MIKIISSKSTKYDSNMVQYKSNYSNIHRYNMTIDTDAIIMSLYDNFINFKIKNHM